MTDPPDKSNGSQVLFYIIDLLWRAKNSTRECREDLGDFSCLMAYLKISYYKRQTEDIR